MRTRLRRSESDSDSGSAREDREGLQEGPAGAAAIDDRRPQALAQLDRSMLANAGQRMDRQRAAAGAFQRKSAEGAAPPNQTGLPDQLKAGIEALSGIGMDGVKVHYNSPQPAQVGAHAYAQGTEIHLAPGQERHLPHEAWHVVQQAQGRVLPTMQLKGAVSINDDLSLEREADAMGARALAIPLTPAHGVLAGTGSSNTRQLKRGKDGASSSGGRGRRGGGSGDVVSDTFKRLYTEASPDPASDQLGAGPAAISFIVNGGALSSHHHIFPKSRLIPTAKELSKWQVAASLTQAELTADSEKSASARVFTGPDAASLRALATMVTGKMRNIGLERDGMWNLARKTDSFYWLPGNLFRGISSGYRVDDPGSSEERVRPASFAADAFGKAKVWGNATVALSSAMRSLGSGFSSTTSYGAVETRLDAFIELREGLADAMHETSREMGADWVIPAATTAHQYVRTWGMPGHHYSLNTSAANKFAALPNYLVVAADHMTLAIRKSLSTSLMENIAAPLLGPQAALETALRQGYADAGNAANHDPVTVFAAIVGFAAALTTIQNTLAAWALLPAAVQADLAAYRTELNGLRTTFSVQFGGILG